MKVIEKFKSMTKEEKLKYAGVTVLTVGGVIVTVVAVKLNIKNEKEVEKLGDKIISGFKKIEQNIHCEDIIKNGNKVGSFTDFIDAGNYVATLEVEPEHIEEALNMLAESSKKVVEGIAQTKTICAEVCEF